MALALLHRAVDRAAMWLEDLVPRAPDPYRPGPDRPLGCLGALPPPPSPPAAPGPWRFAVAPWGGPPGDRALVHVFPAPGPRRGTALLVPPWKLRAAALLRGWATSLSRAGLETWLLVPPHHLERAAAGARNGEAFVSPDLGRLRAALEETVLEIRLLAAAAAPAGPVGAVGLSLGALAAGLAAAASPPLDFAALVAPPADVAAIFGHTPLGSATAAWPRRAGPASARGRPGRAARPARARDPASDGAPPPRRRRALRRRGPGGGAAPPRRGLGHPPPRVSPRPPHPAPRLPGRARRRRRAGAGGVPRAWGLT
jgi:hypothetical protein